MASPDLAGVERFNFGLATVTYAFCTECFAFLCVYSFFFALLCDHLTVPFFIRGLALGHLSIRGWRVALPPLRRFFLRGGALFSPLVWFFGTSPRDAERGLRKISILFVAGWNSSLFWIYTPLSRRHLSAFIFFFFFPFLLKIFYGSCD